MKKLIAVPCVLALVLLGSCGKETAPSASGSGSGELEMLAPGTPGSAYLPASADASTLSGVVKFEGVAPKNPTIEMSGDPYCETHKTAAPVVDEEVLVSPAGELANVLVYVKDVKGTFPKPAKALLVDQKGCKYEPRVSAVQVNQTVAIRNSDSTLHNVHGMPETNEQFNVGQPVPMTSTKVFDKAELKPFKLKCDVHGWMKSWMAVLPNPFYAVSQANGTFTIPNLPPGTYTVVAWHEKYGQQEQQLTVGPKETKALTFNFKS